MLTLYHKPTCLYSQDVIGEAQRLGLHMRLKDISSDVMYLEELQTLGGRSQTPFLVNDVTGEKLYESTEIIAYLQKYHEEEGTSKTFGGLRIHNSDEICESCQ